MIISNKKINSIKKGIPLSCNMQHALRLVLPDYRFNPTEYENCIKNKIAEVYPCCVYSNNSEIKPLGYITADDVKNSNIIILYLVVLQTKIMNQVNLMYVIGMTNRFIKLSFRFKKHVI